MPATALRASTIAHMRYLRATAAAHLAHAEWQRALPEPADTKQRERYLYGIHVSLHWARTYDDAAARLEAGEELQPNELLP